MVSRRNESLVCVPWSQVFHGWNVISDVVSLIQPEPGLSIPAFGKDNYPGVLQLRPGEVQGGYQEKWLQWKSG